MSESKISVTLDFDSTRAHFLRAIQHQLDIISLLIGGAHQVTPAQVQDARGFHNFSPLHDAELPHEEARVKAIDWLNCCFLRDAIEATDLFLGRCLSFCATIHLVSSNKENLIDLDHIINVLPSKHSRLHFPEKISTLEKKYGIRPEFSDQVLSLNKLRTCLVHRLGRVSKLDTTDGDKLIGKWISSQIVLRGLKTGAEIILREPGPTLEEESALEFHVIEHQREFPLGGQISLSPYETFSTIFTLWKFGLACGQAIELYATQSGFPLKKPLDSH